MIVYRRDFWIERLSADVDRGIVNVDYGLAMYLLACGPHL